MFYSFAVYFSANINPLEHKVMVFSKLALCQEGTRSLMKIFNPLIAGILVSFSPGDNHKVGFRMFQKGMALDQVVLHFIHVISEDIFTKFMRPL